MTNQDKTIIKLCSFYVSDWHLTTMILPYINNKINENTKIATILENNIQNNVEMLVKKLKLKNDHQILALNWKSRNTGKYAYISKMIDNSLGNSILIIISGKKEYIDGINKSIMKYINKNKTRIEETNTIIKIVDCYEIIEFNGNIVEILDEHDKILNTSGEREINEIFEDYVKTEKIS